MDEEIYILGTGGSSPLARGLPRPHPLRRVGARIIPARAGFTRSRRRPHAPSTDHPRSRGVYGRFRAGREGFPGSSPLARGLPPTSGAPSPTPRIIPARAGFTPPLLRDAPHGADHPRSRGVYRLWFLWTSSSKGSSPLARGLLVEDTERVEKQGIIPARAGFTFFSAVAFCAVEDHPRSRGVYGDGENNYWSEHGSSPLARGLLPQMPPRQCPGRIIPARAGFTGAAAHSAVGRRDHPRSRGVYERARR